MSSTEGGETSYTGLDPFLSLDVVSEVMRLLLCLTLSLRGILSMSSCPPQCLCADGNIVCTCESTASSELSINSLGGSFAKSFVVHSCSRVTIQNGSFAGVVLQDRLTFVAINRLIIEPGAFRGILQSPKQVVLEQCNLPRLLHGSFDGLSRLQHIWFKKSSIDAIEEGAFHGVGPVDYLYFRETTISYLQRHAFGGMRHIRHVFFRGGIRIDSSEAQIFANSSVGELVMDDVIAILHEAVLLDLVAPVIINNSTIRFTSRGETLTSSTVKSESLTISVSRLNSFSPLLNHQFGKITLQTSKIHRIRAPDSQVLGYIPTVLRLFIEECEIESFEPLSLAHTRVAELKIRDSRVGNFSQNCFSGSKISKITVEDSRIGDFQPGAFVETRVEKMGLHGGKVIKISPKAFDRSDIRRLELSKVEIRHLGDSLFGEVHNLTVTESRLPVADTKPFRNSKTTHVSFHHCDFNGLMRRSFLEGLDPVKLSIRESRFDCDTRDCELNAMLFSPIREDLLWSFEQNSCDSNVTKETVCSEPTVSDFGSLRCHRTALVADCVCTSSTARLPAFDVQVLVIGDCDEIILDEEGDTSPSILYLYRVTKSDFHYAPKGLRVVNVYHSNLILRPSFGAGRLLDRLWLDQSVLYIEDGALNHATIMSLKLQHSRLTGLSPFSLEGTAIEQLTINGSRLETAAPLLMRTHRLSLHDSLLGSPEGLADVKFAHLTNNTILCCCERDCPVVSSECHLHFSQVKCLSPSAYKSSSSEEHLFRPLFSLLVPLVWKFL